MKILAENYQSEEFDINKFISHSLQIELTIEEVVECLNRFSEKILSLDLDNELVQEVSTFCSKSEIENKIKCELGSIDAYDIKRRDFKTSPMESFYPLGVVLHVTPSNSPGLAFLAMVESLLGLNSNIIKLSRRDSDECFILSELLFSCDPSGKISKKSLILQDSKIELEKLVSLSDAISCWGGDESISSIRDLVPVSKRFINWGHKISLSLISKSVDLEEAANKLAKDIIKFDQMACSAPQICYLLDANFSDLESFSLLLSKSLMSLGKSKKQADFDIQEQAELTNIKELIELESVFQKKKVVESKENDWRIFLEEDSGFKASPLKRSIWLKPITKNNLVSILSPHRSHLQTVGVALTRGSNSIVSELLKAGALRIRNLGAMQDSYSGEPHDGEQALRRFVKRVSIDVDIYEKDFRINNTSDLQRKKDKRPIMTKEDFQKTSPNEELAHLFFRSGGSSGKTAISPFSYHAYHRQMQAAAEGLFAAGLDPNLDQVANMFFGGGLYGGFLSFYTILEKLEIVQYPLAAYEDKEFLASVLVENNINTIVGMPSFIVELFESQRDILKKARIKKIFFGGEHFGKKHRGWLKSEFGVELIRSASYGSVDAGPLGFQCEHSDGGVHHLNESIQDLEILNVSKDEPVQKDDIGRLVFTSKARDCISIERYDIGDLGRWISDPCPCGRSSKRFELLGRHGDIFRAGGTFFNYMKFQKILRDEFHYEDALQIELDNFDNRDRITIRVSQASFNEENMYDRYQDLFEAVVKEKTVFFKIEENSLESMKHSLNSGKLLRVIDARVL